MLSSWHDYFMTVGAGAAALTGLVFVAMTLHLDDITRDPVHRHRARSILTGLTAVFIRCSLVLMGGQNAQAIAVELIVVLAIVEVILYSSIRSAASTADRGVLLRALGSFACLIAEQAGAVVFFFGGAWGLYAVGLGVMSSYVFMVTGAWLLLVGVGAGSPRAPRRGDRLSAVPSASVSSPPPPTSPPVQKPARPVPQSPFRSTRFWITLGILLLANIFITNVLLAPAQPATVTLPYDVFKQQVAAGYVVSVTTTGDSITGVTKTPVMESPSSSVSATHFTTQRPSFADDSLEPLLEQHGVTINAKPEN